MSVLDLDQLAAVQLPTADEEIWRYSRIDELDMTAYRPVAHAAQVSGATDYVVVGGDTVELFADQSPDVFADLNRSAAAGTTAQVRIVVPPGVTVAEPIVITHTIAGDGGLVCPRLVIEAGADSQVTVIERFLSSGAGPALVLPVLQLAVEQAARVEYLAVNELSDDAWSIGHQQAVGYRDSSTLLATVALGGDYARVRTEARLSGKGGSTRQVALYFAGGSQMHDFRTIQDHDAPHTHSDLLFKGAVQDRSASVYTGLIKIREHARGTNAFQTNRNLKLSDDAWAESVPNLEIENNEVRCSHASTVSPVDEEQRFYLESRGVPTEEAERLIVAGFLAEVIGSMPVAAAGHDVRSAVAAKLARQRHLVGSPA